MSTFAFDTAQSLVCSYVENGVHRLSTVDLASLAARPVATPFQDLSSVRAVGGRVYFRGGSPADPPVDRRARPRLRRQQNTEAVDHPGHRALPRLSVGAGAGDLRHRQRPAGPRPLLPAAQRRFRRIRGRIAAADRALPWRPDRRRLGDPELGHAILDQPRLCGARRQLRRQHRIWPRIPAAAARQLGDRRRRRLRQRRALSGAGAAGGRPRALGDQRRQRRRLHHARGADLPQRIQDRGQLLRGQRPRSAGQGHPQIREPLTSTA